jgi:hypothetical protein
LEGSIAKRQQAERFASPRNALFFIEAALFIDEARRFSTTR